MKTAIDETFIEPTETGGLFQKTEEWPRVLYGRRDWHGRVVGSTSKQKGTPQYIHEDEVEARVQGAINFAQALATDNWRSVAESTKYVANEALARAEAAEADLRETKNYLKEARGFNLISGLIFVGLGAIVTAYLVYVNGVL